MSSEASVSHSVHRRCLCSRGGGSLSRGDSVQGVSVRRGAWKVTPALTAVGAHPIGMYFFQENIVAA